MSLAIRAKSCKRVAAEEVAPKVAAENIMAELKLFSDEMRAARVEIGMFQETVAGFSATIKAQNKRIEQLEKKIDILATKLQENF